MTYSEGCRLCRWDTTAFCNYMFDGGTTADYTCIVHGGVNKNGHLKGHPYPLPPNGWGENDGWGRLRLGHRGEKTWD